MISPQLISKIGVEEKYLRAYHYNSIKVWWARRPVRAMRAIIINEVLQLRKAENDSVVTELIDNLNPSDETFQAFQKKYSTSDLKLLDVFSGGGSIPLESARLGLETISVELNPVAALLQHTIFDGLKIEQYPEKLQKAGHEIIKRSEKRLSFLFDYGDAKPYTIFWSKTLKCPSCNRVTNLSRLEYLSKRKGKEVIISDGKAKTNEKGFSCTHCKATISFADIKEYCKNNKLGNTPLAMCYHDKGKKRYKSADAAFLEQNEAKSKLIELRLTELQHLIPNEAVDIKAGVINPTLYDLKQHRDFFNPSQLLVLLTVIDEIKTYYHENEGTIPNEELTQIVLGLTTLLEFLIDWNSTGTMWIAQNEQTGRSLAGPGVAMKWDYIEVNPFYQSGSNLYSKIDRVCKSISAIRLNNTISIQNTSSANIDLPDGVIDLIVTDPPYYDSIDYTALSEFFRPWFEVLIRNTFDSKVCLKNDTRNEAIAELANSSVKNKRQGSHYHKIMRDIFAESKRVLKDSGKLVFIYGHKTLEGWEVIAKAVKDAGLYISNTYPLDMERPARPRAMLHQSLNGVVLFEALKEKKASAIEGYFKNIEEVQSAYIPIHLAGLACKMYTSENISFQESYQAIVDYYKRHVTASQRFTDPVLSAYIDAVNQNDKITTASKQLLKTHHLVNDKGELYTLKEILHNGYQLHNTVFDIVMHIYNEFSNKNQAKVNTDIRYQKDITNFFAAISGVDLNTLANRSFDTDKKIARLILSKINIAQVFDSY